MKTKNEGPVVTYTTATKDYDWLGTVELDPYVATTTGAGKPKTIRKVDSPADEVENMRARYSSGLHMAVNETEWKKLVAYKLVELRPTVAKTEPESLAAKEAV